MKQPPRAFISLGHVALAVTVLLALVAIERWRAWRATS